MYGNYLKNIIANTAGKSNINRYNPAKERNTAKSAGRTAFRQAQSGGITSIMAKERTISAAAVFPIKFGNKKREKGVDMELGIWYIN